MAKLTKDTLFTSSNLGKETVLDKTTRIVREITEIEAEKRQTKMARLRTARLAREASTPEKPVAGTPTKTGKKIPVKAKTLL